jgi:hypothetical protein
MRSRVGRDRCVALFLVVEHLSEIALVDGLAAVRAAVEVLAFVLRLPASAPADDLTRLDLHRIT